MYGVLPRCPVLSDNPSDYSCFHPLKHSHGNELPSNYLFTFLQLFWIHWSGCQLISPRFVRLEIFQEYHTHTIRCFRTCIGRRANTNRWLLQLLKTLPKRETFEQQIPGGVPNESVLLQFTWRCSYIQLDRVHWCWREQAVQIKAWKRAIRWLSTLQGLSMVNHVSCLKIFLFLILPVGSLKLLLLLFWFWKACFQCPICLFHWMTFGTSVVLSMAFGVNFSHCPRDQLEAHGWTGYIRKATTLDKCTLYLLGFRFCSDRLQD